MTAKVENLKQDAADLYRLSDLTERRRVKDILVIEAKKLETEISRLQEAEVIIKSNPASQSIKRAYDVKINTYAWDQTDSLIKILVTLANIQTLAPENISCNFTNSSFELLVKEFEGKNYILSVKNLLNPINAEKCLWKVKSGMVVISLFKSNPGTNWASLVKTEKDNKVPKVPKMDNDDPSAGLMNLMKQMYEDGDDEMKRTIAKAWVESREKNMNV